MLKDLIISQRSYRSFDPALKVDETQLRELVDHARFCPSSFNLQPLKYRLVTNETEVVQMISTVRWAGKLTDTVLPPKGHSPSAFIVICADTGLLPTADKLLIDVGIAAETIMLAATERGLGGCMFTSLNKDAVRKVLSLPDHVVPQIVLALGKPDEQVLLTDPSDDGSVSYYRENGIHYVPKRLLDDLIIKP